MNWQSCWRALFWLYNMQLIYFVLELRVDPWKWQNICEWKLNCDYFKYNVHLTYNCCVFVKFIFSKLMSLVKIIFIGIHDYPKCIWTNSFWNTFFLCLLKGHKYNIYHQNKQQSLFKLLFLNTIVLEYIGKVMIWGMLLVHFMHIHFFTML